MIGRGVYKMNTQYMEYQLISKHRKYIMGIAAIMIIICHNTLVIDLQPWDTIIKFSRHFFQIGVDIFLLVSGIGCVFSYYRDENISGFLIQRFVRIIPTYIIAIFLWGGANILVGWGIGIDFFWEYSLISFFINGINTEWYVASILLLYLLFLPFYKVLQKSKRLYLSIVIFLYFISFVFSVVSKESDVNELFIVRIPVYMMGILVGEGLVKNERKKFKSSSIRMIFSVCILTILLNYMLNTYNRLWVTRMLFMPTAITFSLMLSWKREYRRKSQVRELITAYGTYTFENYLVNEKIITLFACIVYRFINKPIITSILVNVFGAIFTIVASVVLNKIVAIIKFIANIMVRRNR